MKLPELILKQIIDELLEVIRTDYDDAPSEEDTFLYQVFFGNVIEGFDFYEQSKSIFLRTQNNPRQLETRMMFDSTRAELPTIHVVLPSENMGKDNALGIGRGFQNHVRQDGVIQYIYSRSFDVNYQLAITSGNAFETIMIYQGLKAAIISAMDTFELNGLKLPSLSGNDLDINTDLMPNVFCRAITVEVDYEVEVPSLVKQKPVNNLTYKGEINNEGR